MQLAYLYMSLAQADNVVWLDDFLWHCNSSADQRLTVHKEWNKFSYFQKNELTTTKFVRCTYRNLQSIYVYALKAHDELAGKKDRDARNWKTEIIWPFIILVLKVQVVLIRKRPCARKFWEKHNDLTIIQPGGWNSALWWCNKGGVGIGNKRDHATASIVVLVFTSHILWWK